ncbi:MAG: UTP--glucose-1-phosphate uridylyltransferase [Rickettsiales bacterium]|nr:UTP--glucose-1-phosphate uridylyltransferase [Rickettsiales bacterium]
MRVKTAIFPVGGLGTRFLPATKSLPKEMLPVLSKPIIQYAFEEAKDAGIEKFIFITGRNKNAINNHFDHAYELESNLDAKSKNDELNLVKNWLPQAGQVAFIRQQSPMGLGHAILCAKNYIANNEPFLVILADEMHLGQLDNKYNLCKEMISLYNNLDSKSNIISVDEVDKKDVSKYGIISSKKDSLIDYMVEKPDINQAPSNMAITGRYIIQPEIFNYLSQKKIGRNQEIQLTDAMNEMLKAGSKFYYKKNCQDRFDCGSVLGYLEANIAFALNDKDLKKDLARIVRKYNI